mgnify:CR=1 FL=1
MDRKRSWCFVSRERSPIYLCNFLPERVVSLGCSLWMCKMSCSKYHCYTNSQHRPCNLDHLPYLISFSVLQCPYKPIISWVKICRPCSQRAVRATSNYFHSRVQNPFTIASSKPKQQNGLPVSRPLLFDVYSLAAQAYSKHVLWYAYHICTVWFFLGSLPTIINANLFEFYIVFTLDLKLRLLFTQYRWCMGQLSHVLHL